MSQMDHELPRHLAERPAVMPLSDCDPHRNAILITTAAYTATGSVAYALIYPIAVPAICFVLSLFQMPETRKIKIWEP